MDLHRKYPIDTVCYKCKPLHECTPEELMKAAQWVIKRISAMSKEIKNRTEFALEFAKVLPRKGGQKILKTALSLTTEQDKLKYMAEQIRIEIKRR